MDLHVEHFSLNPLIKELSSTIEPLMKINQNTLEISAEDNLGIIRSDLTKLRQILLNLLGNASKFTANGKINLNIYTTVDANGKWVTFEVKDNGIGITPEQLDKIFHSFSQAEPDTIVKYGGTGLGLSISKHLCQLIGGRITADSVRGTGSTFTITIPASLSDNNKQKALQANGRA